MLMVDGVYKYKYMYIYNQTPASSSSSSAWPSGFWFDLADNIRLHLS
jgi:hypothetical protein